jgi:hypothetical protein
MDQHSPIAVQYNASSQPNAAEAYDPTLIVALFYFIFKFTCFKESV